MFGQPALHKDWGVQYPGEEGVHHPVALEYVGDGDDKSFVFVLGEEDFNSEGTRFTLTRYQAASNPSPNITRWPLELDSSINRPVAMAVRPPGLFPGVPAPMTDIFALGRVEMGDGIVRTMTVAFMEEETGEVGVAWTREFVRTSDENDDTVPIAIDATSGVVVVLVAYYTEGNQRVTYGIEAYNASNGTTFMKERHLLDLPGDHTPVDILIEDGVALVSGYANHPITGDKSILTVGFNLGPDGDWFHPDWDPFDLQNHGHVWASIPDYDLEPVRMVKKSTPGDSIFLVGNGTSLVDMPGRTDMFTMAFSLDENTSITPNRHIRWADLYNSGDHDVARDISATDVGFQSGASHCWTAGTTYNIQSGLSSMRVLQYYEDAALDGPTTAFPYYRNRPIFDRGGWAAEWGPDHGVHEAKAFRITHLREPGFALGPGIPPWYIYVAGLAREDAESPWRHRVVSYTHDLPVDPEDPKHPRWDDLDDTAPLEMNGPPIGLDVRKMENEDPFIWFSAEALIEEDIQWYTAQWRDTRP